MNRAEFAINYETSSDLFCSNKIIDFKTVLPIQNHKNLYTSLSVKNILCEFVTDNIVQQSEPTILKTGHSDVFDFYNQKSFVNIKDKNIYNSHLGEYRVRYDSSIKSTYLIMKKTSIKQTQFYTLINKMFRFMDVPIYPCW